MTMQRIRTCKCLVGDACDVPWHWLERLVYTDTRRAAVMLPLRTRTVPRHLLIMLLQCGHYELVDPDEYATFGPACPIDGYLCRRCEALQPFARDEMDGTRVVITMWEVTQ